MEYKDVIAELRRLNLEDIIELAIEAKTGCTDSHSFLPVRVIESMEEVIEELKVWINDYNCKQILPKE